MAQAEFHEVLSVDAEQLYAVVTRYEDYPKFVDGCSAVKVDRSEQASGKVRAQYEISVMSKDIGYSIELREDPTSGFVEWHLVDSSFFKKNSGSWTIRKHSPGKCDVCYKVDIEFKVPVPGFILKRLVQGSLEPMVRSFEKRALSVARP